MYFITICVHNRLNLFGKVINNVISLNDAGKMIDLHWIKLIDRFPHIELDDFVIMPNHLHGIITIVGVPLVGTQKNNTQPEQLHKGQPQGIAPTKKTVGEMIGAFKSITTNEYINNVKCYNWQPFNHKLWQRNYYEHIIRNEKSYIRISEYTGGILIFGFYMKF